MPSQPITFFRINCIRTIFLPQVATGFHGVPDDVLQKAAGFKAVCIFVNKKIKPEQAEILKANGNQV